jgi:hypothetical protein
VGVFQWGGIEIVCMSVERGTEARDLQVSTCSSFTSKYYKITFSYGCSFEALWLAFFYEYSNKCKNSRDRQGKRLRYSRDRGRC